LKVSSAFVDVGACLQSSRNSGNIAFLGSIVNSRGV
jgi:hypothetical protein